MGTPLQSPENVAEVGGLGIVVVTAEGEASHREIVGASGRVVLTNGDGIEDEDIGVDLHEDVLNVLESVGGKQPANENLTAISELETEAFGLSLLEAANEAALKALVNLEANVDVMPALGTVVIDATTARTLAAGDLTKSIYFTSGSAITVTLPNSLSVGFQCTLTQVGTGAITLSLDSGATPLELDSYLKTAGPGAKVALEVYENSGGAAAKYSIVGQMVPA